MFTLFQKPIGFYAAIMLFGMGMLSWWNLSHVQAVQVSGNVIDRQIENSINNPGAEVGMTDTVSGSGAQVALPQATAGAEEVSMIAVGDIMLSRTVATKIKKQKDLYYPFLKIRDWLKTGDIAFANLETAIAAGRVVGPTEMSFRSEPAMAQVLKDVGFTILSVANNHSPNFGAKGLLETFTNLQKAGILFAGAGADDVAANTPTYFTVKGIRFALLAYNDPDVVPPSYEAGKDHPGTAFMRIDTMTKAVQEAKKNADLVLVSMHSGTEYVEKANKSQTAFAHAAIDAGAEMVIGHHPHVVQNAEVYSGKMILYSLGNFVFDQMDSADTRSGLGVKILFTKSGVSRISFYPIWMQNYAQPQLMTGTKADKLLERLQMPLMQKVTSVWNAKQDRMDSVTENFLIVRDGT